MTLPAHGVLDLLTPEQGRELERHLKVIAKAPQPHVEYQKRPDDWIVDKLGISRNTLRWAMNAGYKRHRWDGTQEPIVAIMEGLASGQSVGVESCTGGGKSFIGACLMYWFLACWRNSIVNSYAPKEDQLRLYIWKEAGELWPRFKRLFPTAVLGDLRIRMDGHGDKWSAHGIATAVRSGETSATKAQGAHARDMLLIVEEMPGVDAPIITALRRTMTARHNIMLGLGNPDDQQDALHRFCVLPTTKHVIISALDHPNVVSGDEEIVPGAASPSGIINIASEDEPGTPGYESRVRGISPAQSVQSLIKLKWIEAAAARYEAILAREGPPALGVDAANSPKGDLSSKAFGRGAALVSVRSKQCPDANVLGSEVFDEAIALGIDPSHIGVDPVGVGAGTVNEMVRLGMDPQRLGGSLAAVTGAQLAPDGSIMDWAPDANLFINLRAQMAWQLREDFRNGELGIHPEVAKRLAWQLTAPQYRKEGGKVVFEAKKDIVKRIGRSPDDFDAIMYWNWVRPRSDVKTNAEAANDHNPSYDYSGKRLKPRHRPINEDGTLRDVVEDDLRDNRFWTEPQRFKTPRWGGGGDDDEYEE